MDAAVSPILYFRLTYSKTSPAPSLLILVIRRVHARALVILLAQGLRSPKFNSRLRDLLEAK
jgi:hypothetical protein